MLNDLEEFPLLMDTSGYLAVKLVMKPTKETFFDTFRIKQEIKYAIVEMPKTVNRFVVLPSNNEKQHIILLDDVIRYNLHSIFNVFDYESISAHMVKITRDAQLEFDSDLSKSLLEKISVSVKERRVGEPVRFVYDQDIAKDTLDFLLTRMKIDTSDSVIPGGRYHNRDYVKFKPEGMIYYNKIVLPMSNDLEGSLTKIKEKIIC
jgi:polyphosphate kinase